MRDLLLALVVAASLGCRPSPPPPPRGADLIVATDDGSGVRAVMHPTPEERIVRARSLPPCRVPALPTLPAAGWRWQTVRPAAAGMPMPVAMRDRSDEVPDDPWLQRWGSDDWGSVDLMLDWHAQQSTGYFIGPVSKTEAEPPCRLQVGPHLALLRRAAFAVRDSAGAVRESVFVAMTDIPFALPDTQLGVGIQARSRPARDSLLSIVGQMRFGVPTNRR